MTNKSDEERLVYWYFGGLASAGATICTHPLDLLKVHRQTQQGGRLPLHKMVSNVIAHEGVMGLYNGLSASVVRQLTYSTIRFAIYETGKQRIQDTSPDGKVFFWQSVLLAAAGGGIGGLVGVPPDLVNVRMQNDVKLRSDQRFNYTHIFNGLYRVCREEGAMRLLAGAGTASTRCAIMGVGQLVSYDYIKSSLLTYPMFQDDKTTHFLSAVVSGVIATTITQPFDVLKTRLMSAKPGQFKNFLSVIAYTANLGPTGFFKGYFLAFTRIAPQTILMFLFLEQLRLNFGFKKEN